MDVTKGPGEIARGAMAAVQAGDRDAWLASFAETARVEDPVGHVPPMAGREALAQFWDMGVAPLADATFEVTREWEAGDEVMLLATVSITTSTGVAASYDGAFNYTVDADSRISLLRAFWDLPSVAAALAG